MTTAGEGESTRFRDSLREFIQENLRRDGRPLKVGDDDALLNRGILDSLGVLEVSRFIEEETGIRIPDRELRIENFQSVAKIDAMVAKMVAKRQAGG